MSQANDNQMGDGLNVEQKKKYNELRIGARSNIIMKNWSDLASDEKLNPNSEIVQNLEGLVNVEDFNATPEEIGEALMILVKQMADRTAEHELDMEGQIL